MSATAAAEPQRTDPASGTPDPAWSSGTAAPTYRWERSRPAQLVRDLALPAGTAAVAGLLCLAAFYAKGGLNRGNLGPMTTLEIALTLGGGVVVAGAVALGPAGSSPLGRPGYGLWPLGLLLAFTALTALSVVWSVAPDESWQDAGRMLACSALFAAAAVLARVGPRGWPAVLDGILLAALVLCGYALLTKVLPDRLDPSDVYARLRAPYGYWNAIGLTAAMGIVASLWLGARRTGHALLSALAYPATGLLLVTLMLAYSRGALVVLAVGVALWFCLVPLRLRGAAVLLTGGLGAAPIVAWVFSQHALSSEGVTLGERVDAGGRLGVLLAAMLVVLTVAGVAIDFATARRAPRPPSRRRLGAILLSLPAIVLLALAGMLAHSHRGLVGSVSHSVSSLTDPNAVVPNTPGRLTAVSSVRARYWKEALDVFSEHPALGAGAGGYETARLRHRTAKLDVRNAHGFVVETLADLGIVGLAFALALLATWMAAAGRATHPFNRRWQAWRWRRIRRGSEAAYTPERIGLLTMLCLVVTFGVHSLVDWTWYVPGNACAALLCAGWLAGRGPLRDTEPGREPADRGRAPTDGRGPNTMRVAIAAAVLVVALLAAWAQWQPLRSEHASSEALALLPHDPRGARAAAQHAVSLDPLSPQALFTLSAIEQRSGEGAQARATLQRAVRLQPSNPQTWVALGEYDLGAGDPKDALNELRAAIYLNPETVAPEAEIAGDPELLEVRNAYLLALRDTTGK